MAERFNLTAQLQLQAPTNTRQVLGQIRSQLKGGINANVNVQANAKNVQQVNKALQGTTKNVNAAARGVGVLNKNLSEAARRFGVITLATGTMLSFAQSVKRAVGEAIAFERELVKISQVTGKTVKDLSGLTQEITRLATGLGVSSSSLLETSRVLAQAGFSAKQTKQALDILAKTTLGPTFDDVTQTVEGAIAVLRQFSAEAARSGGEIKFLESTLDAINAVSKSFAVESSDLISVIRRVGGVFSSAGGSVNELIALFTSVRATTRESAETIATGLRTIFTRIQRTDTVNQLEELGISLRDAEGNFVGAFEAVRRLSIGLGGLDPRNYRFSEIVESLGGFRQIGKVIPLIQQFTVAQDALNVAQAGAGSVAADALTAQQSLAVQVTKVREEFAALIRTLADSETFRGIASGALELARALIKIGEALEPVLPLLTSLLALKIGQGLAPGLSAIVGIGGGKRKAFGGVIHKFAKGGYVPGSGNRDTVPAMLQPGEFVIKKSSAEKLGSDTLNAMNNNRFQTGGGVRKELAKTRETGVGDSVTLSKSGSLIGALSKAEASGDLETYGGAFLRPVGSGETFTGENNPKEIQALIKGSPGYKALQNLNKKNFKIKGIGTPIKAADDIIARYSKNNKYNLQAAGLSSGTSEALEDTLLNGVVGAVQSGVNVLEQDLAIKGDVNTAAALKQANIDQVIGNLFESVLTFSGAPYAGSDREAANAPFDFPSGLGGVASKFPGLSNNIQTDAKSTYNAANVRSLIKKVNNKNLLEAEREIDPIITNFASQLNNEAAKKSLLKTTKQKAFGGTIRKYASGGKADTVPALLTPGEFVVNKGAAQSIGYSNLHKMNQTGVARFNTGGVVGGFQRFQTGGAVAGGGSVVLPSGSAALDKAMAAYTASIYKSIRANNQSLTSQQALNLTRLKVNSQYKNWNNVAAQAQQSTKTFSEKIKQTFPTFTKIASQGASLGGKAVSAGGQAATGVAQGFKGVEGIASAAQNFVFLGSAAAALAGQFGGLDEATSRAVSETAAFASSIVGIGGTVVGLFSQLSSSVLGEAAASTASASADLEEAAASKTAAAANSPIAGAAKSITQGFLLGAAAAAAVSVALKYFAAKARAEADLMKKGAEQQLKGIDEGTASTEGFAQAQAAAAQRASEGVALDKASGDLTSGALGGGLAGAAGGAVIGAAIGSIIPGIGTAIGGALGGLIGGLTGAAVGALNAWSESVNETTRIAGLFGKSLLDQAQALAETAVANRDFTQSLSDIDIEENLSPEERISRRLGAQQEITPFNAKASADATNQLQRLSKEIGKPIAQLTKEDFKDAPILAALFETATQTMSRAQDGLSRAVSESRKTLQEAASQELTGELSFDEIIASGGQFAQALASSQAAIKAEADARIAVLRAQRATAGSDEERAAISDQITAAEERRDRQLKDQEEGYRKSNEAAVKAAEATKRAAAAQEAYRQELLKIKSFTNSLVAAEEALKRTQQSLDNLSSYLDGGDLDFSRAAPAGLDDLSQVGTDRKAFESQVKNIGASLGAEGKVLAEKVIKTSAAIDKANNELTNVDLGMDLQADEFLGMLGIDPDSLGAAGPEFREAFAEAIKDGKIDEEEMKKLLEPIGAGAEEAAEALKRGNELINQQIKQQQQYLNMLQGQRDKELAARQKATDVFMKGAELRAQARGGELTSAQKEAGRQQRAQQALQGIRDPRGRQVQAGNVAQVQAARMAADAERFKIQQMKKTGEFEKKSAQEKAKLIARERELNNIVNKTSDEMERLTDQSGRAADIMGEIEKERGKREAITGIVEDFVFGGGSEREAINMGLGGVQAAVATGTIQNQTEEQRKATRSMLDTLSDVQVSGPFRSAITGQMVEGTGKDVKQELVFRDAIRMGLDPKIAKSLATATSKEEKLIQSLDKLTQATLAAADANVAFEEERTKRVESQAPAGVQVPAGGKPIPSRVPLTAKEQQKAELNRRKQENEQKRKEREAARQGGGVPPERVRGQGQQPVAGGGGIFTTPTQGSRPATPFGDTSQREREWEQKYNEERYGMVPSPKPQMGTIPTQAAAGASPVRLTTDVKYTPEQKATFKEYRESGRDPTYNAISQKRNQTYSGPFTSGAQAAGGAQAAAPGAMPLDTTALAGVFQNFIGNFGTIFDNIVKSFSGIQNTLTQLTQSMGNFTMQHTVTVEGLISIGGLNIESIKQELSTSIGQMVAGEVQRVMNERNTGFQGDTK